MKKLLMSIVCIATLFLSSCETETTGDVSRVTVFPELQIIGDATMLTEVGQSFADPGANATIGGTPVAFQTGGNLDTNTPGFYTIIYSVENSDGFEASAQRTVIVYENNGTAAGVYNGIRVNRGFGGFVLLSSAGGNNYNCSDLLGGYYHQGLLYGPAYAFPGVITIPGDGTVTSAGGGAGGFGPVALLNGVDSGAGVLTWFGNLTNYGGFGFDVQLTKITP